MYKVTQIRNHSRPVASHVSATARQERSRFLMWAQRPSVLLLLEPDARLPPTTQFMPGVTLHGVGWGLVLRDFGAEVAQSM
jgi:hypothetical protein